MHLSLYHLERFLFSAMIVALPLEVIPKRFAIPFVGQNLPMAFLFLTLLIVVTEGIKKKNLNIPHKKFFTAFLLWPVICLVIGSILYPYPVTDLDLGEGKGVRMVMMLFPSAMDLEGPRHIFLFIIFLWHIVKTLFIPLVGIFFIVWHLYGHNTRTAMKDVSRAAFILAVLCSLYSIPEILWLITGHDMWASILTNINPWLYDPASAHGWWPPLLWKGQLRSLFAEPSYFGIAATFMIPFLWKRLLGRYAISNFLFVCWFTFMIFMTSARTGIIVILGEVTLLVIFSFLYRYEQWKKMLVLVLVSTGIAFFLSAVVVPYGQSAFAGRSGNSSLITAYVEKNITSVAGTTERSNGVRYGSTAAALLTGLDHPVTGVGDGYEHRYLSDHVPALFNDNGEINLWRQKLAEKGLLNSGFPNLNQYAWTFAREGLPGLLLFITPPLYVFLKLLQRRALFQKSDMLFCTIALLGQMAVLMSNHFFITYPVILSLMYCMVQTDTIPRKADQNV